MKIISTIFKLLGCLAIAFVGYFIMAAVGWPEPLETMVRERRFVGGAFILLGALCAVASLTPRKKTRSPTAMLFADAPADLDDAPRDTPTAPEPATAPAAIETLAAAPPSDEAASPTPQPPSVATVQALLAKGDKCFSDGATSDALKHYTAALDQTRGLHATAPSDETQDLLASALKSVGDGRSPSAAAPTAATAYEEALGIRMERLQAAPDDPQRKRAVSLLLERLGDVCAARGQIGRAQDLYRQSLPIAQNLVDAEPDNRAFADDLASTKQRLAELESRPPI